MNAMLDVRDLSVGYARKGLALDGVSLSVPRGTTVAVLGANGAGRTTLIRALFGLPALHGGHVVSGTALMDGRPILGEPSHRLVRMGMGQVPEGRLVFKQLNVEENLLVGAAALPQSTLRERLDAVYGLFPHLLERRTQAAGWLSGGEQQMLALGRALVARPQSLLVDELSLGLAPLIVESIYKRLRVVGETLGPSMLIVEQNAHLALRCSRSHRCRCASRAWSPWTRCRSRWMKAPSSRSSDPTARARPRCSTASPACTGPRAAAYRGEDITGMMAHRIARHGIARTFQNLAFFSGPTVLDNLLMGTHLQGSSGLLQGLGSSPRARAERKSAEMAAREVLAFLGLEHLAESMPGELPYGQQKQVEFGRALMQKTRLVLLDEPMAGMSAGEKAAMAELIQRVRREYDMSFLIVEHDVPVLMELSDKIVVLDFGRKIAAYLGTANPDAASPTLETVPA